MVTTLNPTHNVYLAEEGEGESVLGEIAVFTKMMKTRLRRQLFASAERGTISYHKLDSHCCCWRDKQKKKHTVADKAFP